MNNQFNIEIGNKADRKLKARRNSSNGVWFGLGMMGLVGWSVVVPTLLGTGIGMWLDKHDPEKLSWTLTLLIVGLAAGSLNAWYWVSKQEKEMREDNEDDGK